MPRLARRLSLTEKLQLWGTFIYCPLAHMVWGGGFLGQQLGVLDFARGIALPSTPTPYPKD